MLTPEREPKHFTSTAPYRKNNEEKVILQLARRKESPAIINQWNLAVDAAGLLQMIERENRSAFYSDILMNESELLQSNTCVGFAQYEFAFSRFQQVMAQKSFNVQEIYDEAEFEGQFLVLCTNILIEKRKQCNRTDDSDAKKDKPYEDTAIEMKSEEEEVKVDVQYSVQDEEDEFIKKFFITQYPSDLLFKGLPEDKVCHRCLKPGDVSKCSGNCNGYFHRSCAEQSKLVSVEIHWSSILKRSTEERNSDEEIFADSNNNSEANANIKCHKCSSAHFGQTSDAVKCEQPNCFEMYKKSSLSKWPHHRIVNDGNKVVKYQCPQHSCHSCEPKNDDHHTAANLIHCIWCFATYHKDSRCIPAGCEMLSGDQLLCPRHYQKDVKQNVDYCSVCFKKSTYFDPIRQKCTTQPMINCAACPRSAHKKCFAQAQAKGKMYKCKECQSGRLPLYSEIVWMVLESRAHPAIIVSDLFCPADFLLQKPLKPNCFCVYTFDLKSYHWVNRTDVFRLDANNKEEIDYHKKTTLFTAIACAKKWRLFSKTMK